MILKLVAENVAQATSLLAYIRLEVHPHYWGMKVGGLKKSINH
jgi:hypothetical protein